MLPVVPDPVPARGLRRRSRWPSRFKPARARPGARRAGAAAGPRVQRPQRPRARPGRHPHGRPRVDGAEHPDRRRRSSWSRSRPTSGRPTPGTRCSATRRVGTGSGARWNKYPTSRSCFFNGKVREIKGTECPVIKLEDYERTTAPELLISSYERGRLLLGDHRLDPVRPRLRRPDGRCRPRSPTTTSCKQARRARSSTSRPYGDAERGVLVRLLVQLLPARVRPPGAGDRHLQAARVRDCDAMKRALAIAAGFLIVVLAVPNALVLARRARQHGRHASEVPHAQAALVLGAQVMPNGAPEPDARGPHRGRGGALRGGQGRQAPALRRPQPRRLRRGRHDAQRSCSSAASRPRTSSPTTRASTRGTRAQRAKRVFDVDSAIVVTQRFHMARALYDARRAGLKVTGYEADRTRTGTAGSWRACRSARPRRA